MSSESKSSQQAAPPQRGRPGTWATLHFRYQPLEELFDQDLGRAIEHSSTNRCDGAADFDGVVVINLRSLPGRTEPHPAAADRNPKRAAERARQQGATRRIEIG